MDFEGFFQKATGMKPFPFQVDMAMDEELPGLVDIPTGMGKTEAVIGLWLWKRRIEQNKTIPARLVYCLPMRVLVEQTAGRIKKFIDKAGFGEDVGVYILMGGEVEEDWMLSPERGCVVIGTQDMLLSRALNRGYAMSRYRWPVAYGLLNNDCLWVFDEVQLMGNAVATSAQLQAFRNELGVFGECRSIWMSATLDRKWLETVDYASEAGSLKSIGLSPGDLADSTIQARFDAGKRLERFEVEAKRKDYIKQLAGRICEDHRASEQTLVVVNTVERAVGLFAELQKHLTAKGKSASAKRGDAPLPEVVLLHSRFRRGEKRARETALYEKDMPEGGRIIVSTQVVEAGVDISSALLFTELAPWPSMVQRFGRCNRYGEKEHARIIWMDFPLQEAAPYSEEELEAAKETLCSLEGKSVAPRNLERFGSFGRRPFRFVIRKRDFGDLFNNTPDLSGNDIDISRFIREDDHNDVYLFWRDFEGDPGDDQGRPVSEELCPAPVGIFKDWLSKAGKAFVWDYLDGRWARAGSGDVKPGMIYMLNAEGGGYSDEIGWSPGSSDHVEPLGATGEELPESVQDDEEEAGKWVTLPEHSAHAGKEMEGILEDASRLVGLREYGEVLRKAALFHDLGKAGSVFQEALLMNVEDVPDRGDGTLWAKRKKKGSIRYSAAHFRHELLSALSIMARRSDFASLSEERFNLLLYLVACHHGKVRLAIRSMPDEGKGAGSTRIALGVKDGDELGPVDFGGGLVFPHTVVDLGCMEMGRNDSDDPSWLERTLGLLGDKDLGPLRLAYLEAVVRAADVRASINEKVGGYG